MTLTVDMLLRMRGKQVKRIFFVGEQLAEFIRQLAAVEFAVSRGKFSILP